MVLVTATANDTFQVWTSVHIDGEPQLSRSLLFYEGVTVNVGSHR